MDPADRSQKFYSNSQVLKNALNNFDSLVFFQDLQTRLPKCYLMHEAHSLANFEAYLQTIFSLWFSQQQHCYLHLCFIEESNLKDKNKSARNSSYRLNNYVEVRRQDYTLDQPASTLAPGTMTPFMHCTSYGYQNRTV